MLSSWYEDVREVEREAMIGEQCLVEAGSPRLRLGFVEKNTSSTITCSRSSILSRQYTKRVINNAVVICVECERSSTVGLCTGNQYYHLRFGVSRINHHVWIINDLASAN